MATDPKQPAPAPMAGLAADAAPTSSADDLQHAAHWLDGLAGRAGAGPAHADGQHVREALQPQEAPGLAPWAEIERLAAERLKSGSGSMPISEPEPGPAPDALAAPSSITSIVRDKNRADTPAANQARWRPWHALAASLLLGGVLIVALRPAPEDAGMRGVGPGGAPPAGAVWRVAQPNEAAQALATELRALGATVELHGQGPELSLQVLAPAAAVGAVNQRLAPLESALDAQGRLTLRVLQP